MKDATITRADLPRDHILAARVAIVLAARMHALAVQDVERQLRRAERAAGLVEGYGAVPAFAERYADDAFAAYDLAERWFGAVVVALNLLVSARRARDEAAAAAEHFARIGGNGSETDGERAFAEADAANFANRPATTSEAA